MRAGRFRRCEGGLGFLRVRRTSRRQPITVAGSPGLPGRLAAGRRREGPDAVVF
jgi:hypothetical protein